MVGIEKIVTIGVILAVAGFLIGISHSTASERLRLSLVVGWELFKAGLLLIILFYVTASSDLLEAIASFLASLG